MFGRAKARRLPDYSRRDREAFKRLATERGFAFEKARDGYLEIKPCEVFPDGLSTAFHDWTDALERVLHCIANPEAVVRGGYSE